MKKTRVKKKFPTQYTKGEKKETPLEEPKITTQYRPTLQPKPILKGKNSIQKELLEV